MSDMISALTTTVFNQLLFPIQEKCKTIVTKVIAEDANELFITPKQRNTKNKDIMSLTEMYNMWSIFNPRKSYRLTSKEKTLYTC